MEKEKYIKHLEEINKRITTLKKKFNQIEKDIEKEENDFMKKILNDKLYNFNEELEFYEFMKSNIKEK